MPVPPSLISTVPLVPTELVPICAKQHYRHFILGQKAHIWAQEDPLCVCYTAVHLWGNVQCENTPLSYPYFPRVHHVNRAPCSFRNDLYLFAGTSTPPGISATAVPSIATPIGVNGFSALPPQSNGQPTSEPIYTNGIHPYPGEPIRFYVKKMRYICHIALTLTLLPKVMWECLIVLVLHVNWMRT